MPDPTEVPVNGTGLPKEQTPQQPQQAQYGCQQPQQQYNYQQPLYNYQQSQQPQYNYRQGQQPQYGYQQPQYNYQQSQQPLYGYQQPLYNYQPSYGCRQPQAAPAVTHTRAIGSMVMMFIALTFLAVPLAYRLLGSVGVIYMIGYLFLSAGVTLMLVGSILGSRGCTLFGIGLLLCIVCQSINRIYGVFFMLRMGWRSDFGIVLLLFGALLVIGTVLAAIGCLARVKALKIVGGILMLAGHLLFVVFSIALQAFVRRDLLSVLYFIGVLFLCIAVLTFPVRKPKNL